MTETYDIIIVGAGHNGLVAAAYLAKAGKKVLVLERRPIVGGSVVTEEFAEGFKADAVWTGGTLRPDIVKDLKLPLPAVTSCPPFNSLLDVGRSATPTYLTLDSDPAKAAESIKRFSEKDAAKWPEFVAFMDKSALFLDSAYATIMPRLPKDLSLSEGYGLAEMALDLRLMGRTDMLNLIRLLPMTVVEFLEEWFKSEQLKAAVASLAIHGVTLGVMSAGTGYTLLHNWLNRGGLAHANVGNLGELTAALANAVKAHGGEIRTESRGGPHTSGYLYLQGRAAIEWGGDIIRHCDFRCRSEAHIPLARRRSQPAAGIRLESELDQDARLRGETAPPHRRPSWSARRHLRARPVAEISRARLRRGQVRPDLRASLSGGHDRWGGCLHPFPICPVCVEKQ